MFIKLFNHKNNMMFNTEIPYDILNLPTKGLYYKTKCDKLEVIAMTGNDEDILCSESLIKSGDIWKILYNMKVKNKAMLPYEELFYADKIAFQLHIRINAYGQDYEYTGINPITKQPMKRVVDLTKLDFKMSNVKPDEMGEFTFTLPHSKKKIKFKLLNAKEEDEIDFLAEEQMKKEESIVNRKSSIRLIKEIQEVNGDRSKEAIMIFLKSKDLKPVDIMEYKKYRNSLTPTVDLTHSYTIDGKTYTELIPINHTFFFPTLLL